MNIEFWGVGLRWPIWIIREKRQFHRQLESDDNSDSKNGTNHALSRNLRTSLVRTSVSNFPLLRKLVGISQKCSNNLK